LGSVQGTGPNNRIVKADVLEAQSQSPKETSVPQR
jgi:pyruvate/2-oxoglutarate dehydrogenase complex dihydrolipoamide acyltransferase (E2) component